MTREEVIRELEKVCGKKGVKVITDEPLPMNKTVILYGRAKCVVVGYNAHYDDIKNAIAYILKLTTS